LPGQAGHHVTRGEAIGTKREAGRVALEQGVLTEKGLTRLRWRNFSTIVLALDMADINDGVWWSGGPKRFGRHARSQRQKAP
jgi:hypothetical protein